MIFVSRVADLCDPGPFVASNWAMATFLAISTGSWYVPSVANSLPRRCVNAFDRILCQKAKRDEFVRVHRAMNSIPPRTLKKEEEENA